MKLNPGLEFLHVLPLRTQHGLAVTAQPAVEQRGVHAAKISVELEVVGVKVGQARVLADNTRLDRWPGQKEAGAAPWSVPRLPFSCTRRPNSEYVISRTRLSLPVVLSVSKNPLIEFDKSPSKVRAHRPVRRACQNRRGSRKRSACRSRARSSRR